jgi:hypothetical protein
MHVTQASIPSCWTTCEPTSLPTKVPSTFNYQGGKRHTLKCSQKFDGMRVKPIIEILRSYQKDTDVMLSRVVLRCWWYGSNFPSCTSAKNLPSFTTDFYPLARKDGSVLSVSESNTILCISGSAKAGDLKFLPRVELYPKLA